MREVAGVRIELELDGETVDDVAYRVRADGGTLGRAVVRRADGEVGFAWEVEPPEPVLRLARAFLRSLWNGRRKPDAPPWPRRVTRWRATPK